MSANIDNFNSVRKPKIFNNRDWFIEGWYWVLPAKLLQVGEVKSVTIYGKELIVYRGQDKRAVVMDAYCPHLGANLAKGKVTGNEINCVLHGWKFDSEGVCVHVPVLDEPMAIKAKTWPTAEAYGIIWVWTGETPQQPLPFILEWENQDFHYSLGSQFHINSHPHVLLINAIDIQHFHSVYNLPLSLVLAKQELNENAIVFTNVSNMSNMSELVNVNHKSLWWKLCRKFFKGSLNYSVCYWYGTTAIVSFVVSSFQIHIIFATRMLAGGNTQGQTLVMVKKRQGIIGTMINKLLLSLGKNMSDRLIKNNDLFFSHIQFNLKTPLKADLSIMQFINHLEQQKPILWESWLLKRSPQRTEEHREEREKRGKWRDELVND